MAKLPLDAINSLTLHLKAGAYLALDGDTPSASWEDLSGGNRDFTPVGTQEPTYQHNQANMRPCFSFDGTDDYMTGPAPSAIVGASAKTFLIALKVNSIAKDQATISNNDGVIVSNGTKGFGIWLRNTTPPRAYFGNFDAGGLDSCYVEIETVKYLILGLRHNGSTLRGWEGAMVDNYSSVASGATADLTGTLWLGRNFAGAVAYSNVDIGEVLCFNTQLTEAETMRYTEYLAANWTDRGDPLEQDRDIASRRLWYFRKSRPATKIKTKLIGADLDTLTDLGITHPLAPHPTGLGAGDETWRRWPMRITESTINHDDMTVTLSGPGLLDRSVTYARLGRALRTTDAKREGDCIVSPFGGLCFYFRGGGSAGSTVAWAKRESDELVCEIRPGQEAIDSDGIVSRGGTNNWLVRSAFDNGTGGWTTSVPGGSSIAGEATTAPLVFDPDVTTQNVLMSQGAAAAADNRIYQSITGTFTAFGVVMSQHLDDSGAVLYLTVSRASDGKYWDGSAWQVGIQYLECDEHTTTPGVDWWPVDFDTSGAPDTFTMSHVQKSGGAARENKLYYAHFGPARPYWDRYVVNGATLGTTWTSVQDNYWVPNYVGARTLQADRFTILVEVCPAWNLDDDMSRNAPGTDGFGVWGAWHDSNNYGSGYFDQPNSLLKFEIKAGGGALQTASVSCAALTRNTWHRVAFRKTSSVGELGLTARTVSVFFDGVKGTDAVATADWTEDDDGILTPGGHPALSSPAGDAQIPLGGLWRNLEIYPDAWSDERIAAWRA